MVVKYDYRAPLSIVHKSIKAGRKPHQFNDEGLRVAQRITNLHNDRLDQLRRDFRGHVPEGSAESVVLEVSGEWMQRLTSSLKFQQFFDPRSTYSVA
jgi:hypothetical protein